MFELAFVPAALKELNALDASLRGQIVRKLEGLRENPHVPSMRISGYAHCYRIKARKAGVRAIYHVSDRRITITVIRVARRDKDEAYRKLTDRLLRVDP